MGQFLPFPFSTNPELGPEFGQVFLYFTFLTYIVGKWQEYHLKGLLEVLNDIKC